MSDAASLPAAMALQCSEMSLPTGAFNDPPHTAPGLPHWLSGEESACQCRRPELLEVDKSSWRRRWQATPMFLPEESQGWGSPAGYGPWGHKE